MWSALMVLSKAGIYASLIGSMGAAFSLWLIYTSSRPLIRKVSVYGLYSALCGAFLVCFALFFQVGMTAQSGLSGMFDFGLLSFLWATPVGEVVRIRLVGLFVAGIGFTLIIFGISRTEKLLPFLFGGSVFLLAASFFVSGHTAGLTALPKIAIGLHLVCIGFWIGSLLPLFWAVAVLPAKDSAVLLKRFGDMAIWLVVLLTVAGGFLIIELLGSPLNLFRSTYGGGLVLKFSLVLILLLMAARNRYSLVPRIAEDSENSADEFRVTVIFEMIFAVMIFIVIAAVTTLTGPGLVP